MGKTVILAQGDFPVHDGAAWRMLQEAKRVIACDGAASTYRRRFGRWPDVIIGDLDSFSTRRVPADQCVRIVRVDDQETNDLTKALNYAQAQNWRDLVIVGATGRREDHTLGNVFRALERQVPVVTDAGVFHPVCGKASFACEKDAGVSVFAADSATRMTSKGLRWPLDGVVFSSLYAATLNRTTCRRFSVTSDRPVFVYVAFGNSSEKGQKK